MLQINLTLQYHVITIMCFCIFVVLKVVKQTENMPADKLVVVLRDVVTALFEASTPKQNVKAYNEFCVFFSA